MTGFFQTIKELRFYQVTDIDRKLVGDLLLELKALQGKHWEQSADKFLLSLSRHFASEFFHYYYHEGNAIKRYYRKHISSLDDGFTFAAGWMSNTLWDQKKPDDYCRGREVVHQNRLQNLISVVESQLQCVIKQNRKINRDSRAFHLLSRLQGNILFDEAIRDYLLETGSFNSKSELYVSYFLTRMPAEKHFEMMLDWLEMKNSNQKTELGKILGLTNSSFEGSIDDFCDSMFRGFQVKQTIEEGDAKRNLLYLCHVVSSKKVLNAACELLQAGPLDSSNSFGSYVRFGSIQ